MVVTALTDFGTTSRDFSFNARPADYSAAARDTLQQVNAALIAKMVSLR